MAGRYQRGGPASFQKPENALKRAEELVNVGQKHSALQTLHDHVTNKRHRTWTKVLEQMMFRYVDLCVDLKKGRLARDGLIHYRNVCQQVNVGSLEEVIKYFVKSATDKAEEAQNKAEEVTITVEDLEVDATPEDLMLSYVSGEKGKDRTDRELVTPWFKFLWETYRSVLDILRNNSRLETLYAMTATKAFQFCLTYKRTTEFRRLCDILRNHLANLNKYRDQRDRPDLTQPESLQLYLETRFEQLRVACELALWQEAFRSVEDIQGLIALGKKSPKPQMMAIYYARLTKIFTVSGAHLYNGYAWYKLFNLAKGYNKNLSQTDLQMMASSVLLAALSILPYDQTDPTKTDIEADMDKERSVRMASILGFSVDAKRDARSALSRTALVGDLSSKGVLALVPAEVKQIFLLLEGEFNPLQLCARLGPLLERLEALSAPMSGASPVAEADLGQYKKSLQQVAVLRLVQQLSQVYSVMKVQALKDLVPFLSFGELEQIIVDAVKYNFLQVRLDHRNGTIHLGKHQLESEQMSDHLSTLARRLSKAHTMVNPAPPAAKDAQRVKLMQEAIAELPRLNARAIQRKVHIEKRKEDAEREIAERDRLAELQKVALARMNEEQDAMRRRQEHLKREQDRLEKELREREAADAAKMLEERLKKKGKGKLDLDNMMDKDAIIRKLNEDELKDRQEAEKRMQRLVKNMDHFERAKREVEEPLLRAEYEKKLEEDAQYHQDKQQQESEVHLRSWEVDVAEKQRLSKMAEEKALFQTRLQERRAEEFAILQRERAARIAQARLARQQDRDARRKAEYTRRCRLALEQKRAEEEAAALAEAEERKAREETERRRKLEEAAQRQRAREAEIEARMKAEKEALLNAPPARAAAVEPPKPAAAKPAGGGGYVPPAVRSGGGGYVPPSRRGGAAPAAAAAEPDAKPVPGPAPAADLPPKREPEPAAETGADTWKKPAPAAVAEPAAEKPLAAAPPAEDRWRPTGRRAEAPPRAAGRDAAPPPADGARDTWRPSAARRTEVPAAAGRDDRREPDRWGARRTDGPPPARDSRWGGDAPGGRGDRDRPRDAPREEGQRRPGWTAPPPAAQNKPRW